MPEMAASAAASFVARASVAIVPGAGSWRNGAFVPSSVNSADMRSELIPRRTVGLPGPVPSAASRNLKTAIAVRPMRLLGRRWRNVVNEGLSRTLRLQFRWAVGLSAGPPGGRRQPGSTSGQPALFSRKKASR